MQLCQACGGGGHERLFQLQAVDAHNGHVLRQLHRVLSSCDVEFVGHTPVSSLCVRLVETTAYGRMDSLRQPAHTHPVLGQGQHALLLHGQHVQQLPEGGQCDLRGSQMQEAGEQRLGQLPGYDLARGLQLAHVEVRTSCIMTTRPACQLCCCL